MIIRFLERSTKEDCVIEEGHSILVYRGRNVLGVVQKLRGQDELGRWSKNAYFCPCLG